MLYPTGDGEGHHVRPNKTPLVCQAGWHPHSEPDVSDLLSLFGGREGMSVKDIGLLLGISPDCVCQIRDRALRKLRRRVFLEEWLWELQK